MIRGVNSKAATHIIASDVVAYAVRKFPECTHEDDGSNDHNADDEHASG